MLNYDRRIFSSTLVAPREILKAAVRAGSWNRYPRAGYEKIKTKDGSQRTLIKLMQYDDNNLTRRVDIVGGNKTSSYSASARA